MRYAVTRWRWPFYDYRERQRAPPVKIRPPNQARSLGSPGYHGHGEPDSIFLLSDDCHECRRLP